MTDRTTWTRAEARRERRRAILTETIICTLLLAFVVVDCWLVANLLINAK